MSYLNYILSIAPEAEGGSTLGMFLPLIAILVIFWFFMIRPQAKQQKELRKFRESLQKGDSIVTAGGIYGKVVSINETQVVMQVDENTKLTVDKSSIVKDASNIQGQK